MVWQEPHAPLQGQLGLGGRGEHGGVELVALVLGLIPRVVPSGPSERISQGGSVIRQGG